jgi:hypothetical protein
MHICMYIDIDIGVDKGFTSVLILLHYCFTSLSHIDVDVDKGFTSVLILLHYCLTSLSHIDIDVDKGFTSVLILLHYCFTSLSLYILCSLFDSCCTHVHMLDSCMFTPIYLSNYRTIYPSIYLYINI